MYEIYAQAQEFASKHIAPNARAYDEEARFPKDAFEAMAREGWLSLLVPAEYGGQGGDMEEHSQACMAFAEASASTGLCYMMHNVALMDIKAHGSEQLKAAVFSDVVENGAFCALAESEFGTGTHFYNSQFQVEYGAEGVVLNGTKSMVTSANQATYYLVGTPARNGTDSNSFLVKLGTEGVSFKEAAWQGMGMRSNVSAPMVLEDVKLGYEAQLGEEGTGAAQIFNVIAPYFITGLASVYSGCCNTLYAEAVAHATGRTYPDGTSLADIETVQTHLARLYMLSNAATQQTRDAARAAVAAEEDAVLKIFSSRVFAGESAIECGRIAMRVGGGKAYNKATNIERFLRDSYANQIMAPSVDVLTVWLGKSVAGIPIP